MATTPKFKTISVTVKANGALILPITGSAIMCRSTTGNAGDISLRFGNDGQTDFDAGDYYKLPNGQAFSEVYLDNNSGADVTVKLRYGRGDVNSSQNVNVTNTVTALMKKSATFTALAPVTPAVASNGGFSGVLKAADTTTRTLCLKADQGNAAAGVMITDANGVGAAGGTTGFKLYPGDALFLDTDAAVNAWSTVNTDKIYVVEVAD